MKKGLFIFLVFSLQYGLAQSDSLRTKNDSLRPKKDTAHYNRKAEIIYDSKRYRIYNNYLTFGGGPMYSSVRTTDQKNIGVDFQFHLQKQYFQAGVFLSGDDFGNNKNTQGHLGIGLRYEQNKFNLAAFLGPSYSIFVTEDPDTTGGVHNYEVHNAIGGYISVQAVYKIKYDVGLGGELFADYSPLQTVIGCKVIIFFSGAYRGIKRGFKTKTKSNKKS
ncbi:MAG: hypothetical protein ACXVPQ_04265 [Bacteroidia bacterium]